MDTLTYILLAVGLAILLSAGSVTLVCILLSRRTAKSALKKKTDASGKRGEEELLTDVWRFARSRHSKVLTNIYLPTAKGRTTEIDLILIDRNGIFVIESKNYNGLVYGDENQREWTHILRNGDRFTFYDPVWQNRGHISAVRAVCDGIDPIFFKSIIVFGRNVRFGRVRVRDPRVRVIKAGQVQKAFRELSHGTIGALSYRDILDYYERLLPYSRSTRRQRQQHVKAVIQRHKK